MRKIKKYCNENVHIKITDFELLDVSVYGCDVCFYFEIRDGETEMLLDTDCEIIENAFMGVDDNEDIYYFLEEKEIDFSEEYDDDYENLPNELKKEFEAYELEHYNDIYHDCFFESEEETQEEIIDKISNQLYLASNKFYIVKDEKVGWIEATRDYFGVHLSSDSVEIHKVYNVDMEDWIYEVEGIYFYVICSDDWMNSNFYIQIVERDEEHPFTVTVDDLKNDFYWGYHGKAGDVIYNYFVKGRKEL